MLGRAPYWWRQVEIGRALARYYQVVVETGNEVGKDYLAAGLIPWWLFTRPGSLVVCSAPSQTLLGTVLWKELRRAVLGARLPLGGVLSAGPNASPQMWTLSATGWHAMGLATRGVERLSGQHNPHLLQVVDEASGVADDVFEALDSQDPAKRLVLGNPLRADGAFARLAEEAERQERDPTIPDHERTVLIKIPSTESPDAHLDRSPRGLASGGFLRRSARKYGVGSLWYRTHILARRPASSHDTLIPPDWFDAALGRARVADVWPGHRRISCDLGEGVGRDRTVILVRDEIGDLEWSASEGMGLPEAAAEIARLALHWGVAGHRITFDALGIGKGLPVHLEANGIADAVAYKGSYSGGDDFTNLRTACAWALRTRLEPGTGQVPFSLACLGEHADRLRAETLGLRYHLVGKKTALETKEDYALRLGHSPDYADTLLQSFSVRET